MVESGLSRDAKRPEATLPEKARPLLYCNIYVTQPLSASLDRKLQVAIVEHIANQIKMIVTIRLRIVTEM